MPRRVFRQCLRFALYLSTALEILRARPKDTGSLSPPSWMVTRELGDLSYLMVLPVRRRIHCGIGRFCFCALASFFFVRKDLWLWMREQRSVGCSRDN